MIQRKEYLEKVKMWKDKQVIKVITGIRRCGKSTLLQLYRDWLIENGVSQEQIVFINFEELYYEDLLDYKRLYQYIISKLQLEKMNYIFLDEIQKVSAFEKVVDSLYIKENVDIYITGSNAYLLSGELATFLSGRYIEINMLPFSFAEYCDLKETENKEKLLADYMREGAFPYATLLTGTEEQLHMYLEGIYNTIIIKDIEERQKRRQEDPNKRKVTDIVLLKNIAKFLAGSIGNLISVKSIADYITSSGRKVSQNTIDDYIDALVEPYIFYPVERYDILGKQLLKTNQKFYMADLGLRRHMLPRSTYDLGFSLENIVYLELLRRGYTVNVGKIKDLEVDFVARKDGVIHYFQVTASMTEENTFHRELLPLKQIADNYEKTIITLDPFTLGNYEGIKVVHAIDWLLS